MGAALRARNLDQVELTLHRVDPEILMRKDMGKPILKLTDEDYNEHGLQDLLSARGGAYDTPDHHFHKKVVDGKP